MSQTLTTDTVERVIPAPADLLYDLVADVTRMPEMSPEIVKCVWLGRGGGPWVGRRFLAINRMNGLTWPNFPVVIAAASGREFAVSRTEPFFGTLEWRYVFQPEGAETRVVESYTVTRPLTNVAWFLLERGGGITDRAGQMRVGMQATLERLAAIAAHEQEQAQHR